MNGGTGTLPSTVYYDMYRFYISKLGKEEVPPWNRHSLDLLAIASEQVTASHAS